jgi:hypothetical protein
VGHQGGDQLAAHAALLEADCGVVRKRVIHLMSPVPNAFRIVHSYDRSGREGVVTFAAFTCQPLGATHYRIEENQRFREPEDTAEPLENR